MPRLFVSCTLGFLVFFFTSTASDEAQALRKRSMWDVKASKLPDAKAGGWYLNLGVTGVRAKILPEAPRALEVAYVFDETPAAGKLKAGDKITGVNGRAFADAHQFGGVLEVSGYDGPLRDFGEALEESQGQLDGRLWLDVLRGDEKREVVLQLPKKFGSFSATFPYDCAKSDRILSDLYTYLLTKQRSDGLWLGRAHADTFAALALLASGDAAHLPAARRAAKAFARATTDKIDYRGLDCWKFALYGIFLAEFYLVTRESWVLPELAEINRWLHRAQLSSGGWGHQPGHPAFVNGYGGINVITMQAKIAWGLMLRCGLKVDEAKLRATHEFVRRGTNRLGYVWYKDGGRDNTWCADMGRTGASAIAHYLCPSDGEAYRRVALSNARCIGHFPGTFPDTRGSPLLGMAWTALGALPDPAMFRRLLDANRWHFALAHCPDGTFYYQPNRDTSPHDFIEDPRLCASAVTALILSAKHRRLQLTGAERLQLPLAEVDSTAQKSLDRPASKREPAKVAKATRSGLTLPGIAIDLEQRLVDIDATVCLDRGSLELVACTKDTKEHESIVVVEARPMHIHTALLLLGATAGSPARRAQVGGEEKRWVDIPPRGQLVHVYLVFEGKDGKTIERPVRDFISVAPTGEKLPGEFLFTGSRLLRDEAGTRRYLADASGHVISIATFGDELLGLSGVRGGAGGPPPWHVNSDLLPAIGTKVALRLRLEPLNSEKHQQSTIEKR